jgi:hexosaminidase
VFTVFTLFRRYLDRQVPVDGSKTGWFWLDTWKDMYMVEPEPPKSTTSPAAGIQSGKMLGGEAAMWSEQVDATSFEPRVWPKACAVAERLWSPAASRDIAEASARLMLQRCRMVGRGVRAGPIWADYCAVVNTWA